MRTSNAESNGSAALVDKQNSECSMPAGGLRYSPCFERREMDGDLPCFVNRIAFANILRCDNHARQYSSPISGGLMANWLAPQTSGSIPGRSMDVG
ncbi:hypothetical protein CDAR_35581 [Caerostris darwini]|uniref:Uncharacterized protein n=1 Tax=Caerostris darwini TaxID=1538125 RepID=A0AAV4SM62_9ARAC|nr:hypothetical protein CDAR_35581 [Caerostris darwini]